LGELVVKKEFWWQKSLGKTCAPKIGRELQDEEGVYVFKKELWYQKKIKWNKNS
jgi:hypothetical protein